MNWNSAAEQFLQALASSEPTPGGGAAAAMAGAMGCALLLMAVTTTQKRKATPAEDRPALAQAVNKLNGLHSTLKKLMSQDAEAYAAYLTARKISKEDPTREQAVQDAAWFAATVPADTAAACKHVLKEADTIESKVAPVILSDVQCARHLLKSALQMSAENIRANLPYITQPERSEKLQAILKTL